MKFRSTITTVQRRVIGYLRARAPETLATVAIAVDLVLSRLVVQLAEVSEANPVAGIVIYATGWPGATLLAALATALVVSTGDWIRQTHDGALTYLLWSPGVLLGINTARTTYIAGVYATPNFYAITSHSLWILTSLTLLAAILFFPLLYSHSEEVRRAAETIWPWTR